MGESKINGVRAKSTWRSWVKLCTRATRPLASSTILGRLPVDRSRRRIFCRSRRGSSRKRTITPLPGGSLRTTDHSRSPNRSSADQPLAGLAALHGASYSTLMSSAADRRNQVLEGIASAATLARRDPANVQLIAVSKGRTAEEIEPLIAAGQRDFGESRVQEALVKWPALLGRYPDVRLHCIGRLQSNKAA